MFKDKVAAVILNYHGVELTTRCVESLIGQVALVLVVDNSGDEEETKRLAECMVVTNQGKQGTRIEIVSPGVNLGFATGVDFGIRQLIEWGDFEGVLVINNDAVAGVGMVDGMLKTLRAHGGKAMVGAKMGNGGPAASLLWYHRLFGLFLQRPYLGAFPFLSGACLLVPMSLAINGLFDPDFFMYGEDIELCWRMNQLSVSLRVADATYEHIGSASSQNGSLFYEYHLARCHLLLAKKLARNRLEWWLFLFGRAISLPLRATLRSLRYKSLTPWRGLILAWFGKAPLSPPSPLSKA